MGNSEPGRPIECLLAERFLARCTPDELQEAIADDRRALERAGITTCQVLYVPDDEVCFMQLEARSLGAIVSASNDLRLGYTRVQPALQIRFDRLVTQ